MHLPCYCTRPFNFASIEKVSLSNIVQWAKGFNSLFEHFRVRLLDFDKNAKNLILNGRMQ